MSAQHRTWQRDRSMITFPYGIWDFHEIATQGYYYCDRTQAIPYLERTKSSLFIRPRRFGKSLLLSMLENYYDIARKDQFSDLFGHLAVGANPTLPCACTPLW